MIIVFESKSQIIHYVIILDIEFIITNIETSISEETVVLKHHKDLKP